MSRKSVGTIILDELHGTVLLVLGRESMKWSFPKGHVEKNEDFREAAIRETYEETGIILGINQLGRRLNMSRKIYYEVKVNMLDYLNFKIKDVREILDVKWCKIYDTADNDMSKELLDVHSLNVNTDVSTVFNLTPNIVKSVGVIIYSPRYGTFLAKQSDNCIYIPTVSIMDGQIEPHAARKILLSYGIIFKQQDLVNRIQIGTTAYYIICINIEWIDGLNTININKPWIWENNDVTHVYNYLKMNTQ